MFTSINLGLYQQPKKYDYFFNLRAINLESSTDHYNFNTNSSNQSSTGFMENNISDIEFNEFLIDHENLYQEESVIFQVSNDDSTLNNHPINQYQVLEKKEVDTESKVSNLFVDENPKLLLFNSQEQQQFEELEIQKHLNQYVEPQQQDNSISQSSKVLALEVQDQINQQQQEYQQYQQRMLDLVDMVQKEYMDQLHKLECQIQQVQHQVEHQVKPQTEPRGQPKVPQIHQGHEQVVNSRKRKETAESSTSSSTAKRKKAEVKVFTCPHCSHVSNRKYNLDSHIKTHSKQRVKEFPCEQCGKGFDRRHDRDRHVTAIHCQGRVHVCDQCSASYSHRGSLSKHKVTKHEHRD